VIADAGSTITSGALPLAILVAVAAGFVSFASPCVLPLVPGFLGYVTGLSGVSLEQRSRGRLVLGAVLFVLGFSAVFIGVAVTVTAAGTVLREHQSALMRVGGIIVILMALVFLGVGSQRRFAPRWKPAAGLAGAPLLGMVFGLGWAPCTGPTFGAIMALSTTLSGDAQAIARGVGLATAYSAMVNGGTLVTPHVVAAIGNQPVAPTPGPQVISPTISATLTNLMSYVVHTVPWYAANTLVKGYTIGGKTGTAQIWDPQANHGRGGWLASRYNNTFVGYIGRNAPDLVIAVEIHEGKPLVIRQGDLPLAVESYELFRRIATDSMKMLDLNPTGAAPLASPHP